MNESLKRNYPKILLGIYLIVWIGLAIEPKYRSVWIDENILPVLFVLIFVFTYRKFRFSNSSYSLIFIFLILHVIGGHYSYSEMPLFDYLKEVFGLSRNHYDRVVHFLFGVLWFLPVYDVMIRIFRVQKGWRALFLTFLVIAAVKGVFEVIEYGYVWIRENSLTTSNYLGEQGDSWDSQKDVILGIFGAGIMWLVFGIKSLFSKKV